MKLTFVYLSVVYILATQVGIAQLNLLGNAKDKLTHENLIGVSIYINDLRTGTLTDAQGNFKLENIKPGVYLFEIRMLGYQSMIERLTIKKDTTFNFWLNPSATELSEVVVTAVTRSTELRRSPVIIKSIDKTRLNQGSATNIIDALKNIPGVSQITTGASISKPIIRGLGYNRVITLNNGIRQEGQQWGDEHGIEIDEYAIDKIEIVKGPGSLMYGSDGIAGVLNFISPKAPPSGEVKTQLISNYQTNNQLIGYSFSNAGSKNGFQWLGRFSNKYASNYQNVYDGKVYNSGFKEFDGSLFVGLTKNWGYSHVHLNSFNNTLNLVEGERDDFGKFVFTTQNGNEITASENDLSGYKIGFPHQQINHLQVLTNNFFVLKKGTINIDLGFQNNKRREFGDVINPNTVALFFDLNSFNYHLRYNFAENKGWETSVGMGGMYQKNTNKGSEFLIPNYQLFDIGGFIFTQKNVSSKLTLAGGLRFDNRAMNVNGLILDSLGVPVTAQNTYTKLKFSPFVESYNGVSGSVGLSYQLNHYQTFKLNISRGFRAPNVAELASNGRHEGTFRYELGTPNLNPEISHQIDLAYFLTTEHLTLELTPFANVISNYIYASKLTDAQGNDIIPNPNDPAPAYQFVQGNATLLGAEVFVDFHPHPFDWLHIENSFSFVQASQSNQTDSTKYLPFIPAPKYRGELKAEFKKVGKSLTNVYIKLGISHIFEQNRVFSAYRTETATPAYTLLNAGLGANVRAFGKKDFMSVFISAENLADVAYQDHLSRLKYAPENRATGRIGVYNMGRNVSLKVIFNW